MAEPLSLEERSRQFAEKAGLQLVGKYGYGIDGTVWQTSRQSALKVFAREGHVSPRAGLLCEVV
jgi:hypothetical protein